MCTGNRTEGSNPSLSANPARWAGQPITAPRSRAAQDRPATGARLVKRCSSFWSCAIVYWMRCRWFSRFVELVLAHQPLALLV
jgi:hypothetical protein